MVSVVLNIVRQLLEGIIGTCVPKIELVNECKPSQLVLSRLFVIQSEIKCYEGFVLLVFTS